MKAERLLGLFYDPQKITLEDVQGLQDLLQQCPYFQAAYALLAKAACDRDRSSADQYRSLLFMPQTAIILRLC
jgi:hypothetical protein